MAEENKDVSADSTTAKMSLKPLILVSLAVFVVSLAGFAWMQGLFGPPPSNEQALDDQAPAADQTATEMPRGEEETLSDPTLAADVSDAPATAAATTGGYEAEEWLRKEKRLLQEQRREIETKTRELQLLKRDIEALLAKVQEAKSERIGMMAKLYDNMDPEAVAKQINSMSDQTVVTLLPRMNTRTAAKVMALLDPKRAAQITTRLLALEQ
jgi:flagellar motility protein MotE (MotC chaperone)